MKATTTEPLAPSTNTDVEFYNFDDFKRCFGIGRSHAYMLIADGLIRSINVRRPGRARGRRLIDAASAREFFAKQPSDTHPDLAANLRKARAARTQKAETK